MFVVRKEEKYLKDGQWVELTHAQTFTTEQGAEETALGCGEVFFSVVPYVEPPKPVKPKPPPPPPYVPPKGAPRQLPPPPPPVVRLTTTEGKSCPRCGGPMEMKSAYFGGYWGCPEGDGGFISAKGTYMRIGQMAEKEIAGIPLLEVTRIEAGHYRSKDGKLDLRFVPAKKIQGRKQKDLAYWEAVERATNTVVMTESSCVKLRMALAQEVE